MNEDGKPKLSAFKIHQTTGACKEIRDTMKTRLAHYMVPSVYIELDRLPLHSISGKLDSRKLKALAERQRQEVTNPNLTDRHHRREQNSRLNALKTL